MQPTQKPSYLACVDCGRAFEVPSVFAECKVCADYADSWAETQLDRYLSANEERDLADGGNVAESEDTVWFDVCTVCKTVFAFGPSLSDVCNICAQAPVDESGLAETEDTRSFGVVAAPCKCPACTTVAPVEAVSRVLRDAVMYLCRHGWYQGAYYGPSGVCLTPSVCIVGALAMVCYGEPVDAPEEHYGDPGYGDFEAALAHLDLFLSSTYGVTPYTFNDTKGRTGLQVVGALLKAADEWDRTNGGAE